MSLFMPKKDKGTQSKTVPKRDIAPKTTQKSLPYIECYENGVLRVESNVFSKTYAFDDISFKTLSQEQQNTLYEQYQKFLNTLNADNPLSFYFVNKAENMNDKLAEIAPDTKGDFLDPYREDLTKILKDVVANARNSITTKKYFSVQVKEDSVDKAMQQFNNLEGGLTKDFMLMTQKPIRALSLDETLELIYTINRSDEDSQFFLHDQNGRAKIDWTGVKRQKLTTKDLVAANGLKFDFSNFRIGERYGQSLHLYNIANWLSTNFINDLSECAFESVIALHIRPIPQEEANRLIHVQVVNINGEVAEAEKKAIRAGYGPELISADLKSAKEQIDLMQSDMQNRDQKLFYFTLVATHFAESKDKLKEQSKAIKDVASKYSCAMQPLVGQQERGLNACMPVAVNKTTSKRLMTTESLGIFIPFNECSMFDKGGFYYGVNVINKTVIAYKRTNGQNYNGLILGSPGSGKSFSAKREICNVMLNTDADIYIIDPEREYSKLAEAFHGVVIKIVPGGEYYLNPMDLDIDTSHDEDSDPIATKVDFVLGLIESMLGKNVAITPTQKTLIIRSVRRIYADYLAALNDLPVDQNGKKRTIDRNLCPTLLNLYDFLMSQPEPEAQNLALIMESYVNGSFDIFAHKTNIETDNRFVVYDIKDIGTNLKEIGLKICLSNIWNKMLENRSKGKWTWAYIDEFHLLLGSESSAEFCKNIWKRARKWQGVPTGITQNTRELLESGAAQAILNTSEFIMMFRQSAIDRMNLKELLNLSDTDLNFVANAQRGCGLIKTASQVVPFKDEFPENSLLFPLLTSTAQA